MGYTVKKLADMAGVSARTLRYYDKLSLLRPQSLTPAGYRVYGKAEAERLQQIMFFREMGLPLAEIAQIMDSPGYDAKSFLLKHRERLEKERERIGRLIENIDTTIRSGGKNMADSERFEGFKKELVEQNEKKYGKEIREKYGDETVDASNKKLMGMSEKDMKRAELLAAEILETLERALASNDPAGEEAQRAAALHKEWLTLYLPAYSPEAHRGLGEMYLADERFKAYYEKKPGMTELLRDAINIFTSK